MNIQTTRSAPDISVLVVEDQLTTQRAITRALNLSGYHADGANSGSKALELLSAFSYEVMVLDLRLPDMDGIEILNQVQKTYPNLQVIILTAHATLESAIAAVRASAADYLLKPCSLQEIIGAIERVLQVHSEQLHHQKLVRTITQALDELQNTQASPPITTQPSGRYLRSSNIMVDRKKHRAIISNPETQAQRTMELTENETKILAYLMQNSDTPCSCLEMALSALDYEDLNHREAQNIIRPHICRLRSKIESSPEQPRFIHTIRGKGYIFSPK